MSPQLNDVPQTPVSRASSSSLLSSFRNLTNVRNKDATKSGASPILASPARAALSRHQSKGSLKHTGMMKDLGGIPDGGTEDVVKQFASYAHASVSEGPVLGGPPRLEELLRRLESGQSIKERLDAARDIVPLLEAYTLDNTTVIWSKARDLLEMDQTSEAVQAGYALLSACVRQSELTPSQRRYYYDSISSVPGYSDFDRRLHILEELTSGGKNIESFETSIAPLLTQMLRDYYDIVARVRKKHRPKSPQRLYPEETNFSRLFKFVISVTKYNSRIFREEDIESLIGQVIIITRKTAWESDVKHAMKFIDTLMTYAFVPLSAQRTCVEVLCDIHRQLDALKDDTFATIKTMLQSHMGGSIIRTMFCILSEKTGRSENNPNLVRGVVNVFHKLLLDSSARAEHWPKISFTILLSSLNSSLELDSAKLELDILELLRGLLLDPDWSKRLLEGEDLTDLTRIISTCSKRLPVRKVAVSRAMSPAPSVASSAEQSISGSSAEADAKVVAEPLTDILNALSELYSSMDVVQKQLVVALFTELGLHLSDTLAETLIQIFAEERLLYPSNERWMQECRTLVDIFLKDRSRATQVRVLLLNVLRDVYLTSECLLPAEASSNLALMVLQNIETESDLHVLEVMTGYSVNVTDVANDGLFKSLINTLENTIFSRSGVSRDSHREQAFRLSNADSTVSAAGEITGSSCSIIAKTLVRMFIRNINRSAFKAKVLYDLILKISNSANVEVDARIYCLKLLFRIRSDVNNAILVLAATESAGLAAALCRTTETALYATKTETDTHDRSQSEQMQAKPRPYRTISGSNIHAWAAKSSVRAKSAVPRLAKPTAPLWMYPGPRGLPEEPPIRPSHLVFSYLDPETDIKREKRHQLDIAAYLETVTSILQHGDDWEVYSYVLVHLGAQLANHSLFAKAEQQVRQIRQILCDQVRNSTFHEPPAHTNLRKGDVAVCVYHILTMLISHSKLFTKAEEDDLVWCFLLGIGTASRITSLGCIHALSICCHELPLSVSRSLDQIIQRMSQIITQSHVAVHILEFLAGLARLPDLYKNFRDNDYKSVFGVCCRYLEYVRDQKQKASEPAITRASYGTMRQNTSTRDSVLNEKDTSHKNLSEELPQYVYALAFHVITYWFMALKLQDRPTMMRWITKNLSYTDASGREVMEEQGQVTIDLMQRVAYSDRDETSYNPNFAKPSDGVVAKKSWIVGSSLVTVETAGRSGLSQITRRTCSGTRYTIHAPQITKPPRHQIPITTGLSADAFYRSDYVGILPDDVINHIISVDVTKVEDELLIPLPDDDGARRAITTFDRNSVVDGHKAGIIYVGEGQTSESEILANVIGSADYTAFLDQLGTLTRLKGAPFNTQGLDREYNADGDFTYCWRDRVTEMVYHIPTMMPTNLAHDPQCTLKKRHIGNDFVNIVFNDSGLPFQFDTFPSAFNYVYIVITPESRASFVETRVLAKTQGLDQFYKVQVMSKPGFPEISPASEAKIISGRSLPAFVRLLALNASVFSLVWSNREGGEHVSSWRNRLREIVRLRERYREKEVAEQQVGSPIQQQQQAEHQVVSAVVNPRESILSRRLSTAFFTSSDGRTSALSNSTSDADSRA